MFSVLIHLTLNHYRVESAKLRASRANVRCVLTCQRLLRAYVFKCQRALRAYVQTCLACLLDNAPCVLKCSNANVLMCLRANVPRIPCLTRQHSLPD